MKMMATLLGWMPASWIHAAGVVRGRWRWVKRATDWLPALLHHQEGRIQRGLGCGLRFNPGRSAVGFLLGTHDPDIQRAFEVLLRPGMTVYDVGANVGFTAVLAARQVTERGRVLCFEPLPGNARLIEHNAALNGFAQVSVHPVALGNDEGEAAFVVSTSPTWGRLASAGPTPEASGTTRVPLHRLDGIVAARALPAPDLVKMDVEGAEADVLQGAAALLTHARPVWLIELHHTNQAVADVLAQHRYTIRVLGSDADVRTVPGEVQIIAVPEERTDLGSTLVTLTTGKGKV